MAHLRVRHCRFCLRLIGSEVPKMLDNRRLPGLYRTVTSDLL